jgi:LuxR family transcriptional regulator, regulator of acetate metabolism
VTVPSTSRRPPGRRRIGPRPRPQAANVREATDAFAGPVDPQLARRLERAAAIARELLGDGAPELPSAALDPLAATEALRGLIAAVTGELDGDGPEWRQMTDLHVLRMELLRTRFSRRADALDRIAGALVRLREITNPAVLLARAPEELCASSEFDRAVLSRIRDGYLIAEAVHVDGDDAAAAALLAALRAAPPRLEHPLVETEVMRRRRATIVHDAQVHPRVHRPTAELLGWQSYAAAPVVVQGTVVGLLHADATPSGREVDVLDRDVLWAFAYGFAQVFESARLRRSLRREREEMRRFLDWIDVRSGELSDAAIELVAEPEGDERMRAPQPSLLGVAPGPAEERDDRAVFDSILTRRELDVLRLMARGQTNAAIAATLVVAEGTVKFHVNNILRKLHATNRAEAVSRYLRLTSSTG